MTQITTTTNNNELQNLISKLRFENSEACEIVRAYVDKSKLIRNIQSDEPIKQVLRYVFTLIGLKAENIPNEIQKSVLISYIQNDLKHFSVDDIRIAFHLLLKNELDCEPNHFQNFSAMYLSQVMNSYQKQRRNVIAEFNKLKEQEEMKQQDELSPEELIARKTRFLQNSIIQPYKFFLKTGQITFGIIPFSVIYNSIVEDLKIFQLDPEQKQKIYKQAIEEIDQHTKRKSVHFSIEETRKIRNIRDRIEEHGIEEAMKDEIALLCHKISVFKIFETCKNKNIDFVKLVEDKINKLNSN